MKNRKIIRLSGYNYSFPWTYFITICTKDRVHYFGEIFCAEMRLNVLGGAVWRSRNEIPQHYPFVDIYDFICMPNHIHGILRIKKNNRDAERTEDGCDKRTDDNPSLQEEYKWCVGWSLWAIIRGFKIGVSVYAKRTNIPFARQSRFHDHIIRDQKEYDKIAWYIQNNPRNRKEDCYSS